MNYHTESLQISVDANDYFDQVTSHRFADDCAPRTLDISGAI